MRFKIWCYLVHKRLIPDRYIETTDLEEMHIIMKKEHNKRWWIRWSPIYRFIWLFKSPKYIIKNIETKDRISCENTRLRDEIKILNDNTNNQHKIIKKLCDAKSVDSH